MAKFLKRFTKREMYNLGVNLAVMLAVVGVCYLVASIVEHSFKLQAIGKYFVLVSSYTIIVALHNYGKK